jgi:catechol 2,3-dioxygenase-like lactoylglutathione lyase family enzyme
MIEALDHVQIAIPEGGETSARAFYCGTLGMTEMAKPNALAERGGLWLRGGQANLHLGVETDFRPARKAHPAFAVASLEAAIAALRNAGLTPEPAEALPGVRARCFVADPFGNRIELLERG